MSARRLLPPVVEELGRHGIVAGAAEPEALHEQLSELYLAAVRALRERQRAGVIPLHDYARHVEALREAYPLLGLPLDRWTE